MTRILPCTLAAVSWMCLAASTNGGDRSFPLEAGGIYRVDFESRLAQGMPFGGIGCGIGEGETVFYLRNYEWEKKKAVVQVPYDAGGRTGSARCRVLPPKLVAEFRNIRVERVTPSYNEMNGFTLGAGERIVGNRYEFRAPFAVEGGGCARPLSSFRNARFTFGHYSVSGGGRLEYVFAVDGRSITNGMVTTTVEGVAGGTLALEFSIDGRGWTPGTVFTSKERKWVTVEVPPALLPARRIHVRLAATDRCAADVLSFAFESVFDGTPVKETHGWTSFESDGRTAAKAAGCVLDYANYGSLLPGDSPVLRVWGCSSGWKVDRRRPVPAVQATELVVRTAANEAEAVQLVLKPTRRLDDVTVRAGVLTSDSGETLPAEVVDVRRVGYVFVENPTDYAGRCGWWPDPLPPQDGGRFAMEADENQPFWIRVKPPKGTKKGIYRGSLEVSTLAHGVSGSVVVPFAVEVFGFDFPDVVTCETAIGLPFRNELAKYHHTTSLAMAKSVQAKYLRALSDAHLSPHDWWGDRYATWKTSWKNRENPIAAEPVMDWAEWDREMAAAGEAYHFNTFAIRIECMEPVFAGYRRGTPEYGILAGKYLEAVEKHLSETGLLGKGYVYWIDEPTPADYPRVMEGMDLLRRHAPRLRRMLTATPCLELRGAATIWNPTSPYLNWGDAAYCRAAGEKFWWYICNDPVAPYACDYIDHAGVDLRIWLWQTWGEKVAGVLLWGAAYWNCHTMYPDPERRQNPWLDAGSWNGYYTSNGNCDGRLLYPPRACFSPGAKDVDEGPVPSQRYEMIRDGIEDYEYFVMLRRLSPSDPLLKVPPSIYRSMTSFSFDPSHIEKHRVRLAHAIERKKER